MKKIVIERPFEFKIAENCRVVGNAVIRMQKTILQLTTEYQWRAVRT